MAERGGCRQKRARWEAQPGGGAEEGSQLASFLLPQTMWGAMSATLCRTIVEYASRDVEVANLRYNGFELKRPECTCICIVIPFV